MIQKIEMTEEQRLFIEYVHQVMKRTGVDTASALATKCGLAASTLNRYLRGPVKFLPSGRTLLALQKISDLPPPIFKSGEEGRVAERLPTIPSQNINIKEELLEKAITLIEEVLKEVNATMEVSVKARAIKLVYELLEIEVEKGRPPVLDKESMKIMLRLVK